MELKVFVAETLTQIAEGIRLAQEKVGTQCRISPRHVGHKEDKSIHIEYTGDSLERVDFDVLVSSKIMAAGEGDAKIFILDASLQGELSGEHANRLKFPVYVQWPRHEPR